MAFERVYTVNDYFDGPRSGVAAFCGKPYQYCCEWDISKDDYSEAFALTPVDAETLSLILEQWAIWRSWEAAFYRGEVAQSTHPGLPGQHAKYAKLQEMIKTRMALVQSKCRASAVFRAKAVQSALPKGMMRELEVEWHII